MNRRMRMKEEPVTRHLVQTSTQRLPRLSLKSSAPKIQFYCRVLVWSTGNILILLDNWEVPDSAPVSWAADTQHIDHAKCHQHLRCEATKRLILLQESPTPPLVHQRWAGGRATQGQWRPLKHFWSPGWGTSSKRFFGKALNTCCLTQGRPLNTHTKMNKHKELGYHKVLFFPPSVTKFLTCALKSDTLCVPAPCHRLLTNNVMTSGWNVNLNFSICGTTNYNSV